MTAITASTGVFAEFPVVVSQASGSAWAHRHELLRRAACVSGDERVRLQEMGRVLSAHCPLVAIARVRGCSQVSVGPEPGTGKMRSGASAGSEPWAEPACGSARSETGGKSGDRSEAAAGKEEPRGGRGAEWLVVCVAGTAIPAEITEAWMRWVGRQANETWGVIVVPSSGAGLTVAATRWSSNKGVEETLTILARTAGADDRLLALLELAAGAWRWSEARGVFEAACEEGQSAAALVDLMARMSASPDLQRAYSRLASELLRYLNCSQVILGACPQPDQPCRIAAVAKAKNVVARPEDEWIVRAALDEVLVHGAWVTWPPAVVEDRPGRMALRKLAAATGAGSLIAGPVRDEGGDLQGAWIFLGDEGFSQCPAHRNFLRAVERPGATCLRLQRRAQRGWLSRITARLIEVPACAPGRVALMVIILLLASLAIPSTYRVKCNCELQPVIRRYVAAPFDGKLEKSLVEPGDVVAQNQVLARMDGRELRWELAGAAADLAKAAKQVDGFLASGEFGSAEVAKYEVERLTLKTQLLEHRSENLDVRSPIAGIVIGGDLKRAEGVPVQVGQTLFEVAPLAAMDVEIAVPDGEIALVKAGLPVEIVLDAFPGKVWSGRLEGIHPRSEIRRESHVFIGETTLRSADGKLRPGMQGRAKIAGPRKSWGWILFHKPWQKLVLYRSW